MLAFLQKIGKSLMFPIATLPAAAILVRFGSDDMLGHIDIAWVQYVAAIMVAAGNAILGNLPIIFAVGIAMGLAVDGAGAAALAGLIAQLVLVAVLGSVNDKLDMGVFGGVISGVTAGLLYNKFRNIQFPEWLSFFGGRRFVPIITSIVMAILGAILGVLWGYPQALLDSVANWMIGAGPLGAGIYGFLNRLLIPTGLHHVINTVVWFDFGTFTTTAGNIVKGDIPRFLAADPTAGHFQAGFFPIMMFGLPAACLAMFLAAEKKRRPLVAGMFLSIGITAFLTGVTEPIEFMFMFIAPVLYVVYAITTGLAFALADLINLRVHAFGFIELITRTPMMVNAGLTRDLINFVIVSLVFFGLNFTLFNFLIKKFNLPTPGRAGNYIDNEDEASEGTGNVQDGSLATKVIDLLGGKENIADVDACMTRLRVTVKDLDVVAPEAQWKQNGALGLIVKDKGVQAVYGPKADVLKSDIQDMLGA